MTDNEFEKRRKKRNIALGLVLVALVILFFVVTMVKMQGAA
jgi:cell division protein FtsB